MWLIRESIIKQLLILCVAGRNKGFWQFNGRMSFPYFSTDTARQQVNLYIYVHIFTLRRLICLQIILMYDMADRNQ